MKSERFVAVSDNHGDEIDEVCYDGLFRHLAEWKPDVVIHAGDNWNFAAIRKGASQEEQSTAMAPDLDAGNDFFTRLFGYGKKRFFLRGNHDERLWDLLSHNSATVRELAETKVRDIRALCSKHLVKMLPYDVSDGVLRYGKLKVIHGFAAGVGAAGRHAKAFGNVLFGHTHSQDCVPVENHEGPSVALGIGCLLKIKQGYARAHLRRLAHQNGWVYGLIFEDGTYQVFQTKRIGDKFYAASDIHEV